jgi:hypothetical protein
MSGLQASRACMGARVVRRIRLPCERESVLPPSLSYPAFLRPDREECAAAGTLKTATDLFVRTLLGADCFGACQHRDATIVAHGGRIFLREDFKERFHATHQKLVSDSQRQANYLVPVRNGMTQLKAPTAATECGLASPSVGELLQPTWLYICSAYEARVTN